MVSVNPEDTARADAFERWKKAPDPMAVCTKKLNVTPLVRFSHKNKYKRNMLLCFCIAQATKSVPEFQLLPLHKSFVRYDSLGVKVSVKMSNGEIGFCDLYLSEDLKTFNREYLRYTAETAKTGVGRDLSDECMVIRTASLSFTEWESFSPAYDGQHNNPSLYWGKWHLSTLKSVLPISFSFHRAQMEEWQAARFLESLQQTINCISTY